MGVFRFSPIKQCKLLYTLQLWYEAATQNCISMIYASLLVDYRWIYYLAFCKQKMELNVLFYISSLAPVKQLANPSFQTSHLGQMGPNLLGFLMDRGAAEGAHSPQNIPHWAQQGNNEVHPHCVRQPVFNIPLSCWDTHFWLSRKQERDSWMRHRIVAL